jgi:hypothetical protein
MRWDALGSRCHGMVIRAGSVKTNRVGEKQAPWSSRLKRNGHCVSWRVRSISIYQFGCLIKTRYNEEIDYRETQLVYVVYFSLATCFDLIRSSSGQKCKIHKKVLLGPTQFY